MFDLRALNGRTCVNIPVINCETRGIQSCITYLGDWVKVDVDDFVQVPHDHSSDLLQLLKVELAIVSVDEARQRDGGQVAHGHFIRTAVLHDLRAQVTALDRA